MIDIIDKEFEDLIIGYISKTLTVNDLKEILKKLKTPGNAEVFKEYVRINYFTIYAMNKLDTDSIIKEINNRIAKEESKKSKRIYFMNFVKYAAVFILIFGLGYYSNNNFVIIDEIPKITPKPNDIVLSSGDDQVVINNDASQEKGNKIFSKTNLIQKNNLLIYNDSLELNELVYHTLKVPYGKRFNILFSDGSKVSLNSGSILRYPVKFLSNQKREVFLQGEAYFDVAEDKSNLFVVNSEGINVEVHGTKFMVKNYSEDFTSDIVLVSGSVKIQNSLNKTSLLLKPGHKGSVNKVDFKITETKVNTKIYTSWIEGEVIFRMETFDQILKKLERLYNVTIINNREESLNELFNAAIDVNNEDIEMVLEYFNKIYNIEYKIFNNKIIIN
tara:strand:+ start:104 stop:1267 length:1164 start_codon:yes stop_codon:yes gene_type:complete